MHKEQFKFLSSGWFKAVIIALPATIVFGPHALLGLVIGLDAALDVVGGTHVSKQRVAYTDWLAFSLGLGGILGLGGAWLRFLFQQRLSERVSIFNWVVCFLLLSGVAAAFWLLFANGVEFFLKSAFSSLKDSFFLFSLLAVAVYGTYLAITVVVPNHRLDPTSGSA